MRAAFQAEATSACDALNTALDGRDELEDQLMVQRNAVTRARQRNRGIPPAEAERKLASTTAELTALLRSNPYRSAVAAVRGLLPLLPELAVKFPLLDPFRGTAAQGLPQRDLSEYTDVRPLAAGAGRGAGGGRHHMLVATCPVDEAKEGEAGSAAAADTAAADPPINDQMCVLKGFAVEDERRMRRELHALCRLKHPNIMPLRAVCRQRDPVKRYLELPYYPHNLLEWLQDAAGAEEGGGRKLGMVAVLRGVLEGVEYLHQVLTCWDHSSVCIEDTRFQRFHLTHLSSCICVCVCAPYPSRWACSTGTSSPKTCWSPRTASQ